jgi:hypothetical protein
MRDDVLEVLKRDASNTNRNAAQAVASLIEGDETPLRALGGTTNKGDCMALLTPRRLLVGGGKIDRAYEFSDLATAVVVDTIGGQALFPVATDKPSDMFYVNAGGEDFAREVREQIARVRPPRDDSQIWERPDFTHVVRLPDAGLLAAPKVSEVKAGQVVNVMLSSAGVQIRQKAGYAGVLIPWAAVQETRIEGVDQVQSRPSVGAVVLFGVLGLAARRKEKTAYLTVRTGDGEYLIEDGSHLPLELRVQLAPFGVADIVNQPSLLNRWQYQRLVGRADDEVLWNRLDDQGRDGWELVSTLATSDGVLLTLKRPLAGD